MRTNQFLSLFLAFLFAAPLGNGIPAGVSLCPQEADSAGTLALANSPAGLPCPRASSPLDGQPPPGACETGLPQVCASWIRRWGATNLREDVARAIAVNPVGGDVYVTGSGWGGDTPDPDPDYVTVAYSPDGDRRWMNVYDGDWDGAADIAVAPTGEVVFVTGSSGYLDPTGYDIVTLALAARSGQVLWQNRYDGPAGRWDVASSLAVSPDGSQVFVAGYSDGGESGNDFVVIAYAYDGQTRWQRRFTSPGERDDRALAIAASPDGKRVFVTGQAVREGNWDFATIAYSSLDGSELWTAFYNGPGNLDDFPADLAASENTVYVSGGSIGVGTVEDFTTLAYDANTGAVLWESRYHSGPFDAPRALALSALGSLFVTGSSFTDSTHYDYLTVAYDADNGNLLWTARYNDLLGASDAAYDVAVSMDSKMVYVTGHSASPLLDIDHNHDALTIAYDAANGAERWVRRYNGLANGDDAGRAVAVGLEEQRVYVAGWSSLVETHLDTSNWEYDYFLVAYDPFPV